MSENRLQSRVANLAPARPSGRTVLLFLSLVAGLSGALALGSCNNAVLGRDVDDPDGGDDAFTPGGKMTGLRIVPDNDVLLVDLNKAGTKMFNVLLIQNDGSKMDVTSEVTLTLDNPNVGSFAGSTFSSSVLTANKVDFTHVKATYQGMDTIANLTVVWLRTSGPAQDFFYNLPYMGSAETQPLTFQTFIQSIDSFFAVDTTGSMQGEIQNLRTSLSNTIIPAVKKAAVKDAWFGVGAVDDFPVGPFGMPNYMGGPDDQPLILLSPMNASVTVAQGAVDQLIKGGRPRGGGGDTPEGQMEGLYQIATGVGNQKAGIVDVPPHMKAGTLGGVEFRPGAFPVITLITDASFHAKGESGTCMGAPINYSANAQVDAAAHTRAETVAALNKICAKVIGVSAEPTGEAGCIGTADLIKFAQATNAMVPPEAWGAAMRPAGCNAGQCCTGLNGTGVAPEASGLCPLVFKVGTDGSGLGQQIISGISNLALFASFEVVTQKSGTTMGDNGAVIAMGHTTADFVKKITPLDAMPSPPPTSKTPMKTMTGFINVVPGAVVRFTIEAQNDFQAPREIPQVFHATIKILAGGCTDLDQRDVIIVVPPSSPAVG